uniref:Uncharacterized protein n=1 Tax=Zea mays TaxID=4577 RepID=A0A804R990_MAIZE
MPQPALPVRRHPGGGERACRHAHYAVVDLALDTLAAARSFGVEELLLLTQYMDKSRRGKHSIRPKA